ncbi:MAG: ribonuclease E activity regulator RraA [Ignavibacteria bacterium]
MIQFKTSDLCDDHSSKVSVADPIGFRDYGGKKNFYGMIRTVKCFEDNSFVRKNLGQNGEGSVLIIDGGGSLRCALLGDMLGEIAVNNNWGGIVVYGCIRDSLAVSELPLGVKALNTNPLKSSKRNEGQENMTVYFAGLNFVPGEFIYCDEDGILVSKELLI